MRWYQWIRVSHHGRLHACIANSTMRNDIFLFCIVGRTVNYQENNSDYVIGLKALHD